MLAGFLAAYMVFNRFSYAYAVFAIGFWWILKSEDGSRNISGLSPGRWFFTSLLQAVSIFDTSVDKQ